MVFDIFDYERHKATFFKGKELSESLCFLMMHVLDKVMFSVVERRVKVQLLLTRLMLCLFIVIYDIFFYIEEDLSS